MLLFQKPIEPTPSPDEKQISETVALMPFQRTSDPGDTISWAQYPFLVADANAITNAENLAPFFSKLEQLERGEIKRINIVHIGDSHIQADWWTGQIRLRMQERFGSRGRGLVFPYQLADTNSPTDIRSGSNQVWEYRKSTFQQKHIPLGVAGLSIQTSGTQVWLDLLIRQDTVINYAFDQVTLFGTAGPDCLNWEVGQFAQEKEVAMAPPPRIYHTVRNGDTLYGIALRYRTKVSRLQQWNNLRGTMIKPGQKLVVGNGSALPSNYNTQTFDVQQNIDWELDSTGSRQTTVLLDSLTHRLLLRGGRTDGKTGKTRIYGICLENSRQSGILYHAIGVNGVTFYHYNEAPDFWQQLPSLQPDLVIVSLGTNETASGSFQPAAFAAEVDRFTAQLHNSIPEVPVVLTTPSDALRRARYENPAIQQARTVILEQAAANNLATWDLYTLMGGAGAIRAWKAQQLAARDYLHFTKAGYVLQGDLLFKALMEAYEKR